MSLNVHIYASPIIKDSRSLKQTSWLIKNALFNKILIIGIHKEGLDHQSKIEDKIEINRLDLQFYKKFPFLKSLFFYLEWYRKVYRHLKNENISVVQCHSVYDLPIGVWLKKKKKCKLVYDAHELETERNGVYGISQKILKLIERAYIKHTDITLVVSKSILKWYQEQYPGISCHLIRNLPLEIATSKANYEDQYFHKKYSLEKDAVVYIYLGTFILKRGIDIILDAFSNGNDQNHIVFVGYGALENKIIEYTEKYSNIHFHPPVNSLDIIPFAKQADIGISLIENCCLSYYYCLPNKLFEYANAHIPVIASNFPDMADLIQKYDLGWTITPDKVKFTTFINNLNKDTVLAKKKTLGKIRLESWEEEGKKYINLYQSLLKKT